MKKLFFVLTATAVLAAGAILAVCCDSGPKSGPCDIYRQGGTPCVTAHSTTRVLDSRYRGPLYQVQRDSDGATLDIRATRGGYADAAAQDAFCAGTVCRITVIYDQSGQGNDLLPAPPGTFLGPDKGGFNNPALADMAPALLDGFARRTSWRWARLADIPHSAWPRGWMPTDTYIPTKSTTSRKTSPDLGLNSRRWLTESRSPLATPLPRRHA